MTVEAEQLRELDDGRVMVFVRNMGRARLSGVEIEQLGGDTSTAVFRISAGRVTSLAIYWERSRALADLGLEE